MILKQKFPNYIFFFFENKKSLLWTTKSTSCTLYHLYFSKNQLSALFYIFSKELFLLSYLTDIYSYKNINRADVAIHSREQHQANILCFAVNFFLLNITVLATCFLNKVVGSIDYIYSNAAWLEREVGEMNELFFFNKFDTRKLLLNYSDNFAPLKNENFIKNKDLYYCVFENQVIGLNSAVVEL